MNSGQIHLQQHEAGTVIPIRARSGGRRNAIEGVHDGHLKVSITAAPEKGKANKSIIAVLSNRLSVPKSSLEIVSGATSARKRILVRGVSPERIRTVLED